jgi:large subunit ribosomal protein L23
MMNPHTVIKALIRTEKSTLHEPEGKYLFLVINTANKIQIRRSVEQIYKVNVTSVNTYVSQGKLRRVRHQLGKVPDTKKAVVTLKAGQKIEVA